MEKGRWWGGGSDTVTTQQTAWGSAPRPEAGADARPSGWGPACMARGTGGTQSVRGRARGRDLPSTATAPALPRRLGLRRKDQRWGHTRKVLDREQELARTE